MGQHPGAQVWQFGNPSSNYGNSNFDIPQALKGTAVYELPFGMGKRFMNQNAILDAALGGWRLSGTFIYQDGTPFTVLDAGVNDYSQAGQVFANPIKGMNPFSGTCPNGASTHSVTCWFNPAAFQTAAEQGNGVFGTDAGIRSSGRNCLTLTCPWRRPGTTRNEPGSRFAPTSLTS